MSTDQLAEVYGGPYEPPHSLFALIEQGLKRNPHGPATISMHQPSGLYSDLAKDGESNDNNVDNPECLTWTYTQLHRAAMKFAAGLMALGIEPGMRIATLFPNGVQFPLTLWMTAALRLTACHLDPGAVSEARKEELAKYMTSIKPDVVVVVDQQAAKAVDDVLQNHPRLKIIIDPEYKPSESSAWTSLQHLATSSSMSSAEEEKLLDSARNHDSPSRLASILFTSGTSSGNPKGCPRHVTSTTHHLTTQKYARHGFDTSSRILQSSMNFRGIATSVTTHAWAAGAATVISDPAAGIAGQIDAIRKHRITYILFIPALLYAMTAHPEFKALDTTCLKDAQIGGDMCTRDILQKARDAFPHTEVINCHGMTEGGGIFQWPFYSHPLSTIPLQGEIVPLGKAARGARIRIRDPETGLTKNRNEAGELCISCEAIIKSYLDNVQPKAFITENGHNWFRTGDLAVIDTDGIVTIIGRLKDVVKRAGVPLAPAAIESCVQKFTGAQVSVVALSHPTLGAEPLVVVDDLRGKTEREVREEVLSRFNEAYTLGPVMTLEQLGLETFPLNTTGKIMKIELLQRAKDVLGKNDRQAT